MGAAHFYIAIRIVRHGEGWRLGAYLVLPWRSATFGCRAGMPDDCPPRTAIPLWGNRGSDIKVIEVPGIPPGKSERRCGTAMFALSEIEPPKPVVSVCNRADLVVLCAGSPRPQGSGPPAARAVSGPENACASSQKWRDSAHDLIVLPADGHRSKTRA